MNSKVPTEAKFFTTADCLNTPEPEPSKEEILAEALKIVRGETMMLPTKKHLVALAELNQELVGALTACDDAFVSWQVGQIPGRPEDILGLITRVRATLGEVMAAELKAVTHV